MAAFFRGSSRDTATPFMMQPGRNYWARCRRSTELTPKSGLAHCESPRLAISLLAQSENPVSTREEGGGLLRLFPNPTTGAVVMDGMAEGQLDVRLFSMSGQNLGQLFNGYYDGKSPLSLHLPDIPPGLYFCRVWCGQENYSIKLVKH